MKRHGFIALYVLTVLAWTGLLSAASKKESSPVGSPFRLEFKENLGSLVIWIPFEGKDVVFRKKPDFGKNLTVSGIIPLGEDKNRFIGFVWDAGGKKLHLDVNQNLDLTDDSSGVFSAQYGDSIDNRSGGLQYFEPVRVLVRSGSLEIPYIVGIQLEYNLSGRDAVGYVILHSGWQGAVSLGGRKWEAGILDNLDGTVGKGDQLILNVSAEKNQPSMSVFTIARIPSRIFLDAQNYRVSFQYKPDKEKVILDAGFDAIASIMGDLKIEGRAVKRFILESDSQAVVKFEPASSVTVPVGQYDRQRVVLDEEGGTGKWIASIEKPLEVKAGTVANFKVGAPLTPAVSTARQMKMLQLNYQVTGIGGENYREINPNQNPPADQTPFYYELDFCMGKDGRIKTYNWNDGKPNFLRVQKLEGRIDSAEYRQTYEMALAIPIAPKAGTSLFFSAVAHDNDGKGRLGSLGWSSGATDWPRVISSFGGIMLSGKPAGTELTREEKNAPTWPEDVRWNEKYKMTGFTGTPVVDGNPSDSVWQRVDWMNADQWITGQLIEDQPSTSLEKARKSMRFKFLQDDQNYYFLFETKDNAVSLYDDKTDPSNMWQGDCIQMALIDANPLVRELKGPKFVLSRGSQKIASGSFEYG
jgi:hypothetical protein